MNILNRCHRLAFSIASSLVSCLTSCLTFLLISILAATVMITPAQADFVAEVNTDSVAVNDTFELTLSSDDISGRYAPDLTPLEKDFKIVDMSQSLFTHIVNGYSQRTHKWTINLSPKVSGKLTIPSIEVESNQGIQTTQPIQILALPEGQVENKNDENISITAKVAGGQYYLFQEIPLTVRIEASESVDDAELILTDNEDIEVEQQGEDKVSQTIKNGQPIVVIEREYTLRPQKVGQLTLAPIVLKGNFRGKPRQTINQLGLDDLVNQQLTQRLGQNFGMFESVGRAFVTKTNAIQLTIKDNPNATDEWFLPAERVELFSEWQQDGQTINAINQSTLQAGEPITRKISLVAVGAEPEQLPTIDLPKVDGLQLYIDSDKTEQANQTTTNIKGTVARRVMYISVIPSYAGTFELPEINIKWQNTKTDKAEVATLPAETLTVTGTTKDTSNTNNTKVNQDNLTDELTSLKDASNQIENSNNLTDNTNNSQFGQITQRLQAMTQQLKDKSWQVFGLVGLSLGLLIILLLWLYRHNQQAKRHKQMTQPLYIDNTQGQYNVQNQISTQNHNQGTPANQLITDLEHAMHHESLIQVYQTLLNYQQGNQVESDKTSKQINKLIQTLDIILFASDSSLKGVSLRNQRLADSKSLIHTMDTDGVKIKQQIQQIIHQLSDETNTQTNTDNQLPRLYPQ